LLQLFNQSQALYPQHSQPLNNLNFLNHKQNFMKNKGLWILFGFLLFIFGITSIIMSLVGVRWVFLGWLEWGGALLAFVLKILMSIAGIVMVIFARTDWEEEKRESSEP